MSMAEVIKSIEREALREAQSREIGGRNGKPIDCSTLGDEPVIVADNEADKQALRAALSQKFLYLRKLIFRWRLLRKL